MKSLRVLAVLGCAVVFSILLASCGGSGGGSNPNPPPAPLTITSTELPSGSVNTAYHFTLQGTGGHGTYTWSVAAGSLPPGITLNGQTAMLSGTPTTLGTYNFTILLADTTGHFGRADLSIRIAGAPLVMCGTCVSGSLPYGNPGTMYSQTLTATGGLAPYTWCVLESDGSCDDGHLGGLPAGLTITTDSSGNGVIAGTPTTPGIPTMFTVQVTDSESIPSRGTAGLTLTIFDLGPRTLPNAILNNPYNQPVSALGGLGPYTWTLTAGSLPHGLSFGTCVRSQRPTCPISGTPTEVGTFQITLQVVDGENPPAMQTAVVSLTVGPLATNSTLNGNYAIALTGYKNSNLFIMAGSFAADGNGNITGGKLDVNYGQGEPNDPNQCRGNPNCPIAEVIQASGSSYDLSGGTGQGTITLATIDNSGNPHTYRFSIAVSGNACVANPSLSSCGRVILADPNTPATYGSGALKVQDSQYFTTDSFFPVNLAVLVSGIDPSGNRYAAAGAIGTNPTTRVDIDCNGNSWGLAAGCPLDFNDHGTVGSNPFAGSFASDVDASTGRGNFVNIRFPNDPSGGCIGGVGHSTCSYAYYIINKQEMILISGDPLSKPANLALWTGYRQRSNGTGWGLTSLSGNIVVELTALDASGKPDVTTGLFNADAAGNATFNSDENDAGTLSQQMSQGTYAIDSVGNKTGKTTFTGFSQFGAGGAILYLYNGNYGFMVGSDANVMSGVMEMQTGSGFSNGSVSGNFEGGTVWPAAAGVTNSVTYLFADGAGHMLATQNTSGPGGPGGPNNFPLTYQVDATGRAVVQDQNQNTFGILYVVGSKKMVLLPADNAPALNVYISGQPD